MLLSLPLPRSMTMTMAMTMGEAGSQSILGDDTGAWEKPRRKRLASLYSFLDYQGVVLYLGGRETWSIIKAGRNCVGCARCVASVPQIITESDGKRRRACLRTGHENHIAQLPSSALMPRMMGLSWCMYVTPAGPAGLENTMKGPEGRLHHDSLDALHCSDAVHVQEWPV